MGSKAPKQAAAPNPYQVAAAQTASNKETAIANSILGNANEIGPTGKVTYRQIGSMSGVPKFQRTTTLTRPQQTLLNQQEAIGKQLNTTAMGQARRITNTLNTPISTAGLPAAAGDMEDYRNKTEQALLARANPQLQKDYDMLENKLVNQGVVRGSAAFNDAIDERNRASNDARNQIFLASGNEARAQAAQQDTSRERALQERMYLRQTPINEIGALMSGGQVSMPQFTPYKGGQVSDTPIGQYAYNTAQIQQQQANNAAQERAGLYNLAGNVAGAGIFKWSDVRLKRDIEHMYGLTYRYRYLWSDEWHIGVMAQDVPHAALLMPNGFYAVDYGAL